MKRFISTLALLVYLSTVLIPTADAAYKKGPKKGKPEKTKKEKAAKPEKRKPEEQPAPEPNNRPLLKLHS